MLIKVSDVQIKFNVKVIDDFSICNKNVEINL